MTFLSQVIKVDTSDPLSTVIRSSCTKLNNIFILPQTHPHLPPSPHHREHRLPRGGRCVSCICFRRRSHFWPSLFKQNSMIGGRSVGLISDHRRPFPTPHRRWTFNTWQGASSRHGQQALRLSTSISHSPLPHATALRYSHEYYDGVRSSFLRSASVVMIVTRFFPGRSTFPATAS